MESRIVALSPRLLKSNKSSRTLYYIPGITDSNNFNWNYLGNWWNDAFSSSPATSFPSSIDNVIIYGLAEDLVPAPAIFNNVIIMLSSIPTAEDYLWTINGTLTMNNSSANYVNNINGNIIMNNSSSMDGSLIINGNIVLNDNTYVYGIEVYGNVIHNDNSYNIGITYHSNATFNDYSVNAGDIQGNTIFNDNSTNYGTVGNAIFNHGSTNASIVNGNATFNNNAVHAEGADVNGTATFNNASCSCGGTAAVFIPNPPPSCQYC